MRFSVVLSFLVAVVLAGAAVYSAREWLAAERLELLRGASQTASSDEAPKETIVVAAESISFGERLIVTKLQEIEWAGNLRPEGSYKTIAEVVADDSEENARFALTAMTAGEPILTSKITEPGVRAKLSTALTPGKKAVSIRVNDVLGVAGFVLPGDRVDILLTRDDYVDILLQGVKVLAIDQISDDRKDQPSVVRTVTFEVDTPEAQKLTLGAQVGMLSLALRNLASTEIESNTRITMEDLSDFDVADDLKGGEADEKEDIFSTEEDAAEDQRFSSLESLISSMAGDLDARLASMQDQLDERTAIPQPLVQPAKIMPLLPEITKVGVIRNGVREEYKVEGGEPSTPERLPLAEIIAVEVQQVIGE